MKTRTITLIVDEDDYRDIHAEIARYQRINRTASGELLLPDGDSDIAGAIVGEIVRNLREYRALWEAEHRKGSE